MVRLLRPRRRCKMDGIVKHLAVAVVLLVLLGVAACVRHGELAGCGGDRAASMAFGRPTEEPRPFAPLTGQGGSHARSSLVGFYSVGTRGAGIKLTLRHDGTHRFHTFDGLETSRGVWLQSGDTLTLTSRTFPGDVSRYRVEGEELHQLPFDDSIPHSRSTQPLPFKREVFPVPAWAKVAPEQIAEAKKHGVPVAFENDIGMRFVLIPAGTRTSLMAGMRMSWWTDDDPQREVTVAAPFYLQTTDVTREQFDRYRTPRIKMQLREDLDPGLLFVSDWQTKVAFAEWMSGQDSRRTYRMPTQPEFEYAAGDNAIMPVNSTDRTVALPGFRLVSPLPENSK